MKRRTWTLAAVVALPSLALVTVTTCPEVATLKPPLIKTAPPLVRDSTQVQGVPVIEAGTVNPVGKVTTILPSAGTTETVVNWRSR